MKRFAFLAALICVLACAPAVAAATPRHVASSPIVGAWTCSSPMGGHSQMRFAADGSGTIVTTGAAIHWRYASSSAQSGTLTIVAPEAPMTEPVRWQSHNAYTQLNPYTSAIAATCTRLR